MSTYVISDLHGQYKILAELLKKAGFSGEDQLYILGDAIDRGPDGIKILQYVMNEPNMDMLLGNHEFMMLNGVAMDGSATNDYEKLPGIDGELWVFGNGGNKTYYKYKLLKKDERLKLLNWLQTRCLSKLVEVNGRQFLLTHSFFKEDKIDVPYNEIDYRTAKRIVWDTPFRMDLYVEPELYSEYKPWTFIVGHVPVSRADPEHKVLSSYKLDNIIDIDGGCAWHDSHDKSYKGGILLRLDDMKEFTMSFEELDKIK